jgi:uncharacterized delta-60 repeat protein
MPATPIAFRASVAILTLSITASGSTAFAQGGSGVATSARFFDGSGTPEAVAIQADGRVVAGGSVLRAGAGDTDFAVMRFNPDGTPDATFGVAGRVTTDFSGTDDAVRAIAIQDNGKIVVAGITTTFPDALCPACPFTLFAVARYTTAGSLDPIFGTGGRVVQENAPPTDPNTGYETSAIAIAPDMNIFVGVWYLRLRFDGRFVVVRTDYVAQLTSNGLQLIHCCVPVESVLPRAPIAFGSGGSVVTLGLDVSDFSSITRGFLARYTPQPAPGPQQGRTQLALDPSFGGTGVVYGPCLGTILNTCTPLRNGVTVQPDDKPVVAGGTSLMRWTAAGVLDATFGQGGVVTGAPNDSGGGDLRVVTTSPNGSIAAAGSSGPVTVAGGGDFVALTTTGAGTVIQQVTTDFGGDDRADAVRILLDGSVVAAGLSKKTGRTDVAWTQLELTPWRPLLPSALTADFDGDRRADMVVLSASGEWRIATSSTTFAAREAYRWGAATDVPVTADFDADGRTDLAVYRPSTGVWYVIEPRTGVQSAYQWGVAGDVPVPGDYDGDGRTELAVWRPLTGEWFTYNLVSRHIGHYQFGTAGDSAVPRDYDGDGQTDLAVYRPSTGVWQVFNIAAGTSSEYQWGVEGDIPSPGDYLDKGYMDIAVYRPSTGAWWIFDPGTGQYFSVLWGAPDDLAVPGDYIGDRRTDLAVWRPATGAWFVHDLATGGFLPVGLGAPTDQPALTVR